MSERKFPVFFFRDYVYRMLHDMEEWEDRRKKWSTTGLNVKLPLTTTKTMMSKNHHYQIFRGV